MDAATLRACLKSSISRSASLEAEVVIARAHLESRETQVVSLEAELEGMKGKLNNSELWRNGQKSDDGDSLRVDDDDDRMTMRVQAEDLALQLEKVKAQLARSKTKESGLRKTLEKAVEIGREGATRTSNLQKDVSWFINFPTSSKEIVNILFFRKCQNGIFKIITIH